MLYLPTWQKVSGIGPRTGYHGGAAVAELAIPWLVLVRRGDTIPRPRQGFPTSGSHALSQCAAFIAAECNLMRVRNEDHA